MKEDSLLCLKKENWLRTLKKSRKYFLKKYFFRKDEHLVEKAHCDLKMIQPCGTLTSVKLVLFLKESDTYFLLLNLFLANTQDK